MTLEEVLYTARVRTSDSWKDIFMKLPLLRFVFATLLAPQVIPSTVWAQAPLRLLVPVKLGLKNVKAITRITYSAEEPRDYWAEPGYSRYDGI
jgi:hypothetical protein